MNSINIFEFTSYKQYVLARVQAMPRGGHGQFIKIARSLRVSPVSVTQVLKGERNFTDEQAFQLSEHLGLRTLEREYFMRLVAIEKAGNQDLRAYHAEAAEGLRKTADEVKNRIGTHQKLDDSTQSVFYSDWAYSAVRLLTSIPSFKSLDAIADRLGLNAARASEILQFLLEVGLCTQDPSGKIERGVVSTHLDAKSRFINNHRRNWRLKGLEAIQKTNSDELFYSAPCTVSRADFQIIKSRLLDVISELTRKVPDTNPEVLACVNVDWFEI